MKRAGVIGWPVAHSLSPVLHGYWLNACGIAGSYDKIPAAPEEFAGAIAHLRAEGYAGVNVTVPHKEAAFAIADKRDMAATVSGAANLLVFHADHIEGRNTDGWGLQHALREGLGHDLTGKTAVLLGAGGAARGAILALNAVGAAGIHILNRNPQRADALVAELLARTDKLKLPMISGSFTNWANAARSAALLLNSTSAGMSGNPPLDLDLGALPQDAAVCDIVYNPLETPLLKDARARGHKTIDGLGMLMHQAAPSFEAFFGTYPEVTPGLRAALVDALNAR